MGRRLMAVILGLATALFMAGCATQHDPAYVKAFTDMAQCNASVGSTAINKGISQKLIVNWKNYDSKLLALEELPDKNFINDFFVHRNRYQECIKITIEAFSEHEPTDQHLTIQNFIKLDEIYLDLVRRRITFAEANKAFLANARRTSEQFRMAKLAKTERKIAIKRSQLQAATDLQQFNKQQNQFKRYAPPQLKVRTTQCNVLGGVIRCTTQ